MKVFREETTDEKIKRLTADLTLIELSILVLTIWLGIGFIVLGVISKGHT